MLCLKYQMHFLVSFLYVDFSQVNVAALPPSVTLPLFQKYLTGKRTSSGQQINFQSPINHNRCILVVHPNQQKEVGKMQKKKKRLERNYKALRCKRDLCQAYAEPSTSMCQLVQNNTTLFCIASFIQSVSQNHFTGVKQYSYRDK